MFCRPAQQWQPKHGEWDSQETDLQKSAFDPNQNANVNIPQELYTDTVGICVCSCLKLNLKMKAKSKKSSWEHGGKLIHVRDKWVFIT